VLEHQGEALIRNLPRKGIEPMTDPIHPTCPAWCMSDHSDGDDVHWTLPEQLDTLGEHAPLMTTQVRVQGSYVPSEQPPGRVHVDSRIGNDLWHLALILSIDQARRLSAFVVLVAEIIGAP
jgi:hypothetical protein